jgi:hypothetical protein
LASIQANTVEVLLRIDAEEKEEISFRVDCRPGFFRKQGAWLARRAQNAKSFEEAL